MIFGMPLYTWTIYGVTKSCAGEERLFEKPENYNNKTPKQINEQMKYSFTLLFWSNSDLNWSYINLILSDVRSIFDF